MTLIVWEDVSNERSNNNLLDQNTFVVVFGVFFGKFKKDFIKGTIHITMRNNLGL